MIREEAFRRSAPSIWHTDWLVLRGLAGALGRIEAKGSVLDFGCGTQPYRALVTAHGLSYRGADFSADADIPIAPNGTLPTDIEKADVILSMQVLEHVRDLELYFDEIGRALKEDGVLLLSTDGTWLYRPHPQDYRRWTRTGLQHDIETRGFLVEDMASIAGPLATTTLIRLTSFAWILRPIPLVGGAIANLLAVIMNLRAVLEDRLTPPQVRDDNGCVYIVRCRKAPRA